MDWNWRDDQIMQAVRYIGVAGMGWLLDMTLFAVFVSKGAAPGVANMVSATIAAMSVYSLSRRLIFRSAQHPAGHFVAYLAYTELNIAFWAVAVQLLTVLILSSGVPVQGPIAAILAKILITPLSMASNFLVTRWLSHRKRHG